MNLKKGNQLIDYIICLITIKAVKSNILMVFAGNTEAAQSAMKPLTMIYRNYRV
jgi:hypothetical protein